MTHPGYRVIPVGEGFSVELIRRNGSVRRIDGFASAREADAWGLQMARLLATTEPRANAPVRPGAKARDEE